MSAELVNLRRVRKRRARAMAEEAAAANRAAHGTPAALRLRGAAEEQRRLAVLDAHRLPGPPDGT